MEGAPDFYTSSDSGRPNLYVGDCEEVAQAQSVKRFLGGSWRCPELEPTASPLGLFFLYREWPEVSGKGGSELYFFLGQIHTFEIEASPPPPPPLHLSVGI